MPHRRVVTMHLRRHLCRCSAVASKKEDPEIYVYSSSDLVDNCGREEKRQISKHVRKLSRLVRLYKLLYKPMDKGIRKDTFRPPTSADRTQPVFDTI